MDFAIRAESLLLTTPDTTDCSLHTRLYDVRSLIDPDLGLGDENWLIDAVTAHVTPDAWDDVGGPGSIDCYRGLLVVSQTLAIHREIAGLLEVAGALHVPSPANSRSIASDGTRSVPATLDAADDALYDRLAEAVPEEMAGMRPEVAVKTLNHEMQFPLRLDHAALARAGRWPLDESIAFQTQGLPLGVVLDRMLHDDLAYVVRNRELLITSAERREATVHTRLFDVRRLVSALNLSDEWLEVRIAAHIAPESWDDVGGRGNITARRGLLFVTQTQDAHRQIESLLTALSEVAGAKASDGTRSVPAVFSPADEAAFRSLAGIVEANLDGLPLDLACQRLSRVAGVPIWIDPRGIFGLGLFPDEEVSILPAGRTLGGTLEAMLPEGLGYYIQGGQIVITAADEAERRLFTRIYRTERGAAPSVCDQLLNGNGPPGNSNQFWSAAGGAGEATPLGDSWLVVTANAVRHQQIERWQEVTEGEGSHR